MVTGCVDHEFHHGDRRGRDDECRQNYVDISSPPQINCIPFVPCLIVPFLVLMLWVYGAFSHCSPPTEVKAVHLAGGWNRSCCYARYAPDIWYPSLQCQGTSSSAHRSRPIADIRLMAQASRAQHCRVCDWQARNLSSSTRAFACRPRDRAPPPIETPSTTNRLCPSD